MSIKNIPSQSPSKQSNSPSPLALSFGTLSSRVTGFALPLFSEGIVFAIESNPDEVKNSLFDVSIDYHAKARECEKLLKKLKAFFRDLQDPTISSELLSNRLKKNAPKDLIEELKKSLKLFHGKNAGELLENNPRILLQIKNCQGKGVMEAYLQRLNTLCFHYRDLGILYYIQHILFEDKSTPSEKQRQDDCKEVARELNKLSEHLRSKMVKSLQKQQSCPERDAIWQLLNRPELLTQKDTKKSCLEKRIAQCESASSRPFRFSAAYHFADGVRDGDTREAAYAILNTHQLQAFHLLLSEPPSAINKQTLFELFSQMNPELKTALGRALWIACYQPDVPLFSDQMIQGNPYLLLECKDEGGRNIIVQLMDHYKAQATLERFIPVYDSFKEWVLNTDDEEELLRAFNQLPTFAQHQLHRLTCSQEENACIPNNPAILKQGSPNLLEQYADILKKQREFSITSGIDIYQNEMTLPNEPIDCSPSYQLADPNLAMELPADLQVAMVTAELRDVISMGGLAPAVDGMARAYGAEKVRIILPKYDVINPSIQLKRKNKYDVQLNGKIHAVFKANVNGLRCFFIEDELFNVGRNPEGRPNNIYAYEEKRREKSASVDDGVTKTETAQVNADAILKRRWTHLWSHAAELIMHFSKKQKQPVRLVHLHDAQAGGVIPVLNNRYVDEWKHGITPATVFTYHNNCSPLEYTYPEAQECLREIGLSDAPMYAFVRALEDSDMNTTVSTNFGFETQTPLFGKAMERYVRINAFKRKLVGIVNGNSNGWDPRIDSQLKNWKTLDGQSLDLTYGPDDADLPGKMHLIRQQLAEYLDFYKLGKIDPTKPIFLYVGRYDSSQKGIDKLPLIMKEAIANGAQMICIGTDPDEKADQFLKEMEEYAVSIGNQGAIVIRDFKRPDGRLHWQHGNKSPEDNSGVTGIGSLLRAASDFGIFPSLFEPCGLVQGEMHRMGIETIATATGGFVDTIFTDGPHRNGLLFERKREWYSQEQDEIIEQTVSIAALQAKEKLEVLYGSDEQAANASVQQKRMIMRNAALSTWTSTFDGTPSPIEWIKRAYAKALYHVANRGIIPLDVHGLAL